MTLSLKVVLLTASETEVVAKYAASIIGPRPGDKVSGELFLTTSLENSPAMGEEIVIDFTEPTA
jgi:hypothetical protein